MFGRSVALLLAALPSPPSLAVAAGAAFTSTAAEFHRAALTFAAAAGGTGCARAPVRLWSVEPAIRAPGGTQRFEFVGSGVRRNSLGGGAAVAVGRASDNTMDSYPPPVGLSRRRPQAASFPRPFHTFAFQILRSKDLAWPACFPNTRSNIIVNPAWPEERWDNDPGVPRSAYSATVQYSILITPRSIGRHRTSDAEPAERVGARRPSPQVARKCCRSGDRGAACSDDRGGRGVQVTGGAGPTIYTVQYSTYKASQHRTGQYSTVVQTGRFNTP